jgi:diketogulonate reductase-like aldo/keto reductase
LLGLGTWDLRGRACARVVEQALRLGYRHVDTAEMYDNEREVGEGCTPPASSATTSSSPRKSGRRISRRANLNAPRATAWCGCA